MSAVVINFNGGDRVIECLRGLYRQDEPLAAVIVVDNGSTDHSLEHIRINFPAVHILELGGNFGPSAARNAGLRYADTELILLIDNDLYVADDCLSRLLGAYREHSPTVVCPRIILFPEKDIVHADGAEAHFTGTMVLRHGYVSVRDASTCGTIVGGCLSACLLVHRAHVLEAGAFDEVYFFYFEDLEFGVRIRSLGHQIFWEPAAVAYHDRGSGTQGLSFRGQGDYPSRRAYLTLRNRLMTIFIHYRIRTVAVLLPALALYELASLAMVISRGWLLVWARAWVWQVLHARDIWRRRRWVQRARLLDDRELLVSGPLPLAPGLVRTQIGQVAARVMSAALDAYWNFANRWVG